MKRYFFFVAVIAFFSNGSAEAAETKPNIVLIMADDFGYECVGANGGESYKTPHLDLLAESGVRFEHCYVQPLCTPTRVQLMTGMYNVRNYTNFGRLHRSQKTFGNYFRDAGYVTGIFGKWQLGTEKDSPQHFGFEVSCLWQHTREIVFDNKGKRADRRRPRYANPGLEFQGEEKDFNHGEYGPDVACRQAIDFIEQNKDRPFLLYYPMILTHSPFQPTPDSPDWDPNRKGEKYSKSHHFKEMVEYADSLVGRIITKLEETGLREKTLVLFLGDNGTAGGVVSILDGKTYRGGKGSTTIAGMHVPLIISRPGTVKAGGVNSNLVDSTDFLPTLCDAAGISVPENSKVDGISFFPQLTGAESCPRQWTFCWYLGQKQEGKETVCAQDKEFKLYQNGNFFDLIDDPLERHPSKEDLQEGRRKEVAERLRAVLDRYKNIRPGWTSTTEKDI